MEDKMAAGGFDGSAKKTQKTMGFLQAFPRPLIPKPPDFSHA